MPGDGHDLQIHRRVLLADGLDVELGMLAVASGLWSLIAETGTDGVNLDRLGANMHAMLEVGTDHPGCELRAQGDEISTLVEERVHLLLHDVRGLAHAVLEERCLLKDGRVQLLIAVQLSDAMDALLDVTPVGLILGQDILCATSRAVQGQREPPRL